ncbi:hypothetical protein L5515_018606 [Caenorhabditis briggsae]|uniref:Uncharacterized protein n=1 Tax=Caenorhabditis briggsae TaxID=6238 RepID=A0AAE9FBW6_CAEBR|nr:hypothetical protein L5515_018606 [Caenorhabditis briggsae]
MVKEFDQMVACADDKILGSHRAIFEVRFPGVDRRNGPEIILILEEARETLIKNYVYESRREEKKSRWKEAGDKRHACGRTIANRQLKKEQC